jgi:hypothetical protein
LRKSSLSPAVLEEVDENARLEGDIANTKSIKITGKN